MILITGGLGFIGCHLAYYLARQGQEVLLLDKQIMQIPSFLRPLTKTSITLCRCDVLDLAGLFSVLKTYPVKSIVHMAAIYNTKGTLYECLKVNVGGTMNILEASRIMEIQKITLISSQSVYPRRRDRVYEEEEYFPLESYHYISLTKKADEMMCDHYVKEYGLNILTVRPSQIYGPLHASGLNPIQRMAEDAVAGKATRLPDVDPNDGHTLTYVKDCARAIGMVHLAEKPRYSIYNVGDQYVSFGEAAQVVMKTVPDAKIKLGSGKGKKIREPLFLSMERLRQEFAFEPEYIFEKGMRDYIRWLKRGKFRN